MKKEKIEKEKIIKEVILEIGLEKPSENFTDNIMHKLTLETKYSILNYKPVIGKKAWIIISAVIALSSLILILFTPSSEENILEKIGVSINLQPIFDKIKLFADSLFENINIPNSLLLGMLAILILALADRYLKKLIWSK